MELEGTKRHLKLATCEKWTLTTGGKRPFLAHLFVMCGLRSHFDNGICRGEIEHAPNEGGEGAELKAFWRALFGVSTYETELRF